MRVVGVCFLVLKLCVVSLRENSRNSPEKVRFQKERRSSSNHHFSGAMLVFGSVTLFCRQRVEL